MPPKSFKDLYKDDAAKNSKQSTSKPKGRGGNKGNKFIWIWVVLVFVALAWFFQKGKGKVEAASKTISETVSDTKDKLKEGFSGNKNETSQTKTSTSLPDWATTTDWYLPANPLGGQLVEHTGFYLSYNEAAEQPWWVAYELTTDELKGGEDRDNFSFDADPSIKNNSASLADYKGSGYDRGHLAPAADMKWSSSAMSDCFLLSNISPQKHSFNAGIWEKLENRFRGWAKREGAIFIVTGPLLKQSPTEKIGKNNVWVPESFYKVALSYKKNQWHVASFILDQQANGKDLQPYFVSVDEVERQSGLDLFPEMPDELETKLEATSEITYWFTSQRK